MQKVHHFGVQRLSSGAPLDTANSTTTVHRLASPAEVTAALRAFLDAFENLEWDAFRSSFAGDACVFFPSARTPGRFCGTQAIEARFRQVFDEERRAAPGPPYLRLRPEELVVQALGEDVAVVTFHLRNGQRLARRTIVFRRDGSAWRIVHLHGSNVPWPDEAR
jgi:ketosteroid isomerase-like protein